MIGSNHGFDQKISTIEPWLQALQGANICLHKEQD